MAVAVRFGRRRVIVWGDVHAANTKPVRHYRRCGFVEVGQFTNDQGLACVDMIVDVDAPPPRAGR